MNQDAKIRDYVLKKQQQKERANMLRQQRKNQRVASGNSGAQQGNKGYGGNQNQYAQQQQHSRKVMGDPFDNVNDQRDDDMRSQGGRSQHSNSNRAPTNAHKASWNNDFTGDRDAYNDAPQSGYEQPRQQRGGGGGNGGFHQNQQNVNPNASDIVDDDYADADFDSSNQDGFCDTNQQNQQSDGTFGRIDPNQDRFGGRRSRVRGNVQQSVKRQGQQSRFGGRRTSSNGNGNRNGNGSRRRNGAPRQQFASSADQNGMEPISMQRMERSQSSEELLPYGNNGAQFATTGDVKKVLSMVEQLRGQMHALQFQIDAVKTENVRLVRLIADIDESHNKQRPTTMDIDNASVGGGNGLNGGGSRANTNRISGRISKNLRNLKGKKQGHGDVDGNNFDGNQQNGFQQNSHRERGGQNQAQNGFRGNGNGGGNVGMSDEFFSGNDDGRGQPPQQNYSSRRESRDSQQTQQPQQQRQPSRQPPNQPRSGAGSARHRQPQQQQPLPDDDDDEDIAAPPKSSAADLIAKLESQQGAYGGMGGGGMGNGMGMDESGQPPANVERVACTLCGRKFAPSALARHTKICAKVFGQKRKAFKAQTVDDEARKAARGTDQAAVEKELARKRALAKKKWKAQSNMLRNAVRTSKQIEDALAQGKSLKDLPQMPSIPVEDDRVPCPHCGRKFAEETAKRHIPKCQNMKARPKMLRRKR